MIRGRDFIVHVLTYRIVLLRNSYDIKVQYKEVDSSEIKYSTLERNEKIYKKCNHCVCDDCEHYY